MSDTVMAEDGAEALEISARTRALSIWLLPDIISVWTGIRAGVCCGAVISRSDIFIDDDLAAQRDAPPASTHRG